MKIIMGYQKRVVAYIDILGFKETIKESSTDINVFNRVLEMIEELKKSFIKPKNKYEIDAENNLNADTQITQVSDCLIISRLETEKGGIYNMLFDCAYAIHLLIEKGFLCRGSIKVGKMYHNESTIFGEAFIRAYLAESEERYPIIKFDKKLFDIPRIYPANEGYEDWEIDFIKKHCKELMTGIYYLDYFTDYDDRYGGGEGSASIHYSKLREVISDGLSNSKISSVFEKYRWAADQFNKTAKNYDLELI
jgi:hypothetical protein